MSALQKQGTNTSGTNLKLTPEQREIVEKNMPLCGYVYRKYRSFVLSTRMTPEDILQELYLELCRCVIKWNPEESSLATFYTACAVNRLRLLWRRATSSKNLALHTYVSLETPVHDQKSDSRETLTISDCIKDDYDIDKEYLVLQMQNTFRSLSDRERILLTCLVEDANQRDVANQLGCSQSYVSRLLRQLIARLSKEIG